MKEELNYTDEYDYIDRPNIYEDAEKTNIICPDCKALLYATTFGSGPDDFIIILLCGNCGYEENL